MKKNKILKRIVSTVCALALVVTAIFEPSLFSKASEETASVPNDYMVLTPDAFGIESNKTYSAANNVEATYGTTNKVSKFDEVVLQFGQVTFTGDIKLTFGGTGNWTGFYLAAYSGGSMQLYSGYQGMLGVQDLNDSVAGVDLVGGTYDFKITMNYTSETQIRMGLTDNIAGVDLVGGTYDLKVTMKYVDDTTLQIGLWFNDILYGNEYFTADLSKLAAEGTNGDKLGFYMGIASPGAGSTGTITLDYIMETLPADYQVLTPHNFGIEKGIYQGTSNPGPQGETNTIDKLDEVILHFGNVTFGQNVQLNFSGADGWGGLCLMAVGDTMQFMSGYGQILTNNTLSDTIAGVDLVGGTYDLKVSLKYTSDETLQIGLWFNDFLYNEQYFVADLTKLASNGDQLGNWMAILGRAGDSSGTITLDYQIQVDMSKMTSITFEDFGIPDGGYDFQLDGYRHDTLDTLLNTSLRQKVKFVYDGTGDYWFQYGGTEQGTWYGIRFRATSTGFDFLAAGEEFTCSSNTLTSSGDMQFFKDRRIFFGRISGLCYGRTKR